MLPGGGRRLTFHSIQTQTPLINVGWLRTRNMQSRDYWFSAKTYGWGWGLPLRWQGWVAYSIATALLIAMFFLFPPAREAVKFMLGTGLIALLLIAVCWLKGEPPRWRWGK